MRRMLEKTHAEPRRRGGEERESYALENVEQMSVSSKKLTIQPGRRIARCSQEN